MNRLMDQLEQAAAELAAKPLSARVPRLKELLHGSGGPGVCKCREYEMCAVCTAPDQQVFGREYQGSWLTPIAADANLRIEINKRLGPMTMDELQIVLDFLRDQRNFSA